ncbi:RING-H2 finger protein ATL3-like [Gossypium hirsutum]|uniref:RING-H2 finger protein ATL3-like n=1 Tax=Gossypium hirsutum TaxID=3635 RepID=A0ABM2ZYZ1_GOSHI|nr:RING-H2 finger protein ATL3-like [Gossypium hirsutum]
MQPKVSNQQVSLHSPVLIFCQDEFKERLECEICLSELVEGKKARLLPKYNHGFHVVCIHIWFQSHSTCPLYRNPIVVGDEFENSNHLVLGDEANVQVHLQSPNDGFVYCGGGAELVAPGDGAGGWCQRANGQVAESARVFF